MRPILIFIVLILTYTSCKHESRGLKLGSNPYYEKAIKFRDSHQSDSAFQYFNDARDPFLQAGDRLGVARCLINMGIIATDHGDNFGGQELSLSAIPYLDPNNPEQKIFMFSNLNNLGLSSANLKKYEEAIAFYKECLNYMSDSSLKTRVLNNIGNTYYEKKDYRNALAYQKKAYESTDDSLQYVRALSNYALTRWMIDKRYNPVPIFIKAMRVREQLEDIWGQNASYAFFTEYYLNSKPDSALYYAKKQQVIATILRSPDDRLLALGRLVLLSDEQASRQYFSQYQQLADSIDVSRNQAKNQFAMIRYETEKHKAETLKFQKESSKRSLVIYSLLFFITSVSTVAVIWYKKRQAHLKLEKEHALKENQLKMSKRIHDVVANGLYRLMSEIEHGGKEEKDEILDDMERLYEQSRNLSYEDESQWVGNDLEQDIKRLLAGFSSNKVKVMLVGGSDEFWQRFEEVPRKQEIKYVLQELMVNMKKHSEASLVAVRFEHTAEGLRILYSDNGKGISGDKNWGNGLRNTENRIFNMQGSIIFETGKDGGLRVRMTFPIKKIANV